MNKKNKILVLAITAIIVLGAAFGFYYVKAYSNPYNRMAIAMKKSMNAKSQDTSMLVNFKLVPEKYEETLGYELSEEENKIMDYVNSLLEKTIFEMNFKQETNKANPLNSKIQYSMGLLYDNETLVDFMLGMDKDNIELLIPSLINKTFFVSKNDIYKKLNFDLEDFDFEKYFKIIRKNNKLLKKVDKDVYNKIIQDNFEQRIKKGDSVKVVLSNGKEIKCREYVLKLKYNDMIDFIKDIKGELENDKNFREYIRITALSVIEELYDSKDYQAFNLEKEDVKEALDYLENSDDFEDLYEEMMISIDDMFIEVENMSQEFDLDYNIAYAIDWKNNIRSMSMDIDYGFMSVNYKYIFNSIGKKVKFDEFKDNERVDIIKFTDQENEELYTMFEDILEEAGNKLTANKALEYIIRDMKANSNLLSSWYKEYIDNVINEFDKDKEKFIKNLVEELKYDLEYMF